MKRIALLTVLLLAMGLTAGFAAEMVSPTFTLTGDATLTLGYDIDLGTFGMLNETSAALKVVLVPKTTVTKGGEGVYGEITITDFGLGVNADDFTAFDNNGGDVSAKIVAGPVYIVVAGAPDLGFDYAANIAGGVDVNLKKGWTSLGGTAIGYTSTPFSAKGSVVSVGYWGADATAAAAIDIDNDPSFPFNDSDDDTDEVVARTNNEENQLGFGVWLKITPVEMLSVEASGIFFPTGYDANAAAVGNDEFSGFGGKLTLTFAPLTLTVGADYFMGGTSYTPASGLDLLPAVSVALGDDTLTGSFYYNNVPVAGRTDSEADAKVEFVEADADKGFLPIVGATASFSLENLMPVAGVDMLWSATVKLNATIDKVKPYAEFGYNSVSEVDLKLGVALSMITNTVITAEYSADNLVAATGGTADGGTFTLATKITY
jgi:hypothetical protein